MPDKNRTLLFCDFDGTISPRDMGYGILSRFSVPEEWERINRAYEKDHIGSQEAYRRVAPHLRATREEMVRYVLEAGELDPHFKTFCRFCHDRGHDVIIVSDGLDFYIEAILDKYGLDGLDCYANRAVFQDDGVLSFEFPHRNEDCNRCGNCKRSIMRRMRDRYREIVYVGDGSSDLCPAQDADRIFARDLLYSEYRARGKDCFYYNDFSDIQKHLVT
ncbi:MAG: MtnX-like HAD-IB family phosphatase [Syntrophales bacterium]|jgi:2,3-diketo-5-methylthio-1-phosphopentane phosphatase|nr:MtnX-like HAD-IB family phosphatase [Syntrophales bacterium]MCK9527437.1 MtnX-like HAD-IB family phosphatase [Syntrophales bacterium]MDX9921541.1 MtnX-like HAD-IB family phosphatase [Syntrophales bacterium]